MPHYDNMRIMLKYQILILSIVAFLANAQALHAAPKGEALYAEHCSVCHGTKGEGGVGVPLALPSFINSVSNDYLFKTIRHGRPGRIMPAFEELSDAQVTAISQYVRSWGEGEPKKEDSDTVVGDISNGATLYKNNCVQCHGVNGSGGKGTGVTFSRKRGLPIIAPALNNSGFLASATDAMIRDTIIFGREGTPMSSQLVIGLSNDDINDLVSYIRSLKQRTTPNNLEDESAVISIDSPYDMEETLENLKQAITDQNFTLIRIEPLDTALAVAGEENKKQMVLHFCNFGFLYEALSIDPRIGIFLPCRITVVESEGKVKVMAINPLRLSKLFNNDELHAACKKMHDIYATLLEDATL